jgi:hypothetical protein
MRGKGRPVIGAAAGNCGARFTPAWAFFRSCISRDWIYNIGNTYPGDGQQPRSARAFSGLPGYLTTAAPIQAMILFFIERFGAVVTMDPGLVPFSKPRTSSAPVP